MNVPKFSIPPPKSAPFPLRIEDSRTMTVPDALKIPPPRFAPFLLTRENPCTMTVPTFQMPPPLSWLTFPDTLTPDEGERAYVENPSAITKGHLRIAMSSSHP